MASQRRLILSAGLGRFAASDANAQAHFGPDAASRTKELLATSIAKANEAGFDLVTVDIDPKDPEDSLDRYLAELQSKAFVGVNIGYGVRGHKGNTTHRRLDMVRTDGADHATENTELFEKLLNEAWRVKPGIKIMFSNGPHEVITAIQRSFPEAFDRRGV